MAYDESLAHRVRVVLGQRDDVVEKKMFGGLAFMVGGHMACGVLGRDLIVRVARTRATEHWPSRTSARSTSPAGRAAGWSTSSLRASPRTMTFDGG